jgi:hypothetical protein
MPLFAFAPVRIFALQCVAQVVSPHVLPCAMYLILLFATRARYRTARYACSGLGGHVADVTALCVLRAVLRISPLFFTASRRSSY